jgi:hypothetical protein
MLTAIKDFAKDAFGKSTDELQEIQYGDYRILLSNGLFAYLAVVVQGIEPTDYGNLMRTVISELNIKHEQILRDFDGDMGKLPDFASFMQILFNPSSGSGESQLNPNVLSRRQKMAVGGGLIAVILFVLLTIFMCNFFTRLFPLAYPAPTATAMLPTATMTFTPTITYTPTSTQTIVPSPSSTYPPTATETFQPSVTPTTFKAVMTGNVWLHSAPDLNSERYNFTAKQGTVVDVLAIYGNWVKISWIDNFGSHVGWSPIQWVVPSIPFPANIITPAPPTNKPK